MNGFSLHIEPPSYLRWINVETDKDPIHDMLKRINVVESKETAT